MNYLTPLEQTRAGREIYERGVAEGLAQATAKGILIGKIKAAQELLGRPINETQELAGKSPKELNLISQQLECEFEKFIEAIRRV